jgi:hypothetical protein
MARSNSLDEEDWQAVGFPVTVLVVHCPRCGRLSCLALDGALLRSGRRRAFVRATGQAALPELRCRGCESRQLEILEDLR